MARTSFGIWFRNSYMTAVRSYHAMKIWASAKKRLKIIGGGYKGTKEEFEKVKEFWEPFGIKPNKLWYHLYCDGQGGFDPRYIPDTMWDSKILRYFNNLNWSGAYADKCAYDLLFPDLNRPRTIAKNSCGRYYDGNLHVVSREEAMELCLKEDSFIIKKATFSTHGDSIRVFHKEEITRDNIQTLFDDYDKNFVVQEVVQQHPYLEGLNASSLNTLRIITFFFREQCHVLSAQLRIGVKGAFIDNYSSGGFACSVKDDGTLNERAVSKAKGWAYEHPNGFAFKDIKVPFFEDVVNVAKQEHEKIPHLNIIGWDFAVGKDGRPIFIEMNAIPGQNQNGSGPTFGDLTEEVLRDVFVEKTLEGAFD